MEIKWWGIEGWRSKSKRGDFGPSKKGFQLRFNVLIVLALFPKFYRHDFNRLLKLCFELIISAKKT